MRKIPTLFQRNYATDRLVRDEVVSGCEWVLAGVGIATRKWDGTCCLVKEGKLYKRYELKRGKQPPAGFLPAQDESDPITGDLPGWVPVGDGPEDRYHREGWASLLLGGLLPADTFETATYELVGPKIQGNPEHYTRHDLIPHGYETLPDAPRDFAGLREYLTTHDIEGIVWHHSDGRMCKLKGRDFGFKRLDKQAS